MVRSGLNVEDPYFISNKGPTPHIDREEGLPLGQLDIAWVNDSRKNVFHWSKGLKWFERLYAHATMSSARRNVKCKRPFEPKCELDFVLGAASCPLLDAFFEKADPYLQPETAFGEDINIQVKKQNLIQQREVKYKKDVTITKTDEKRRTLPDTESWRLLRNKIVIYPDKKILRDSPLVYSDGGITRRENIYNVKLGIAADHSPQTNSGYSRTPSGAFYSI